MILPMDSRALVDHLRRARWDAATLVRYQERRLQEQLRRASSLSPFHAERLAGIDIERLTLAELPSLPVMTKRDMMANFDRVMTVKGLTRALVESHLEHTESEGSLMGGEYVVVLSGGSSGERGVFVYSRQAAREYLFALFRTILPKLLMGRRTPNEPISMAVVAAGSARHTSGALPSLFGTGPIAATSISVVQPLASIVSELRAIQPKILLGYPSVLRLLAQEQQAGHLDIAPAAVVSCSEQLTSDARALISRAFGVGVYDQFASTEGVVGVSSVSGPEITLAGDLAIFELLDDKGEPVGPGIRNSTVLVTNIFNTVQPIIRYQMQDCFIRQPPSGESGHMRVVADGRTDDMLHYGQLAVHPVAIRSELISISTICEYQIVQTESGIHVDVVSNGEVDLQGLCDRLRAALRKAGLSDPSATAALKQTIARDAASGKFRQFVPLIR